MNGDGDFVKWGSEQALKVGDEVTIKIVDLEEGDEPEVSKSFSNELSSEISKMVEKIKDMNPLNFGL